LSRPASPVKPRRRRHLEAGDAESLVRFYADAVEIEFHGHEPASVRALEPAMLYCSATGPRPGRDAQDQTSAYPPDALGGKEEAAMRSKQEEALLRRARKLVDLGDQLKSIREEVEQIAFDIYDEVGEERESRRDVEGDDKGGGGVTED
jgi:hypothetical protein